MYELAVQRSEAPIIFSCRFRHGSNPSVNWDTCNSVSTYPIVIAAVCRRNKAESTGPGNNLPRIEYMVEKIDWV